MLSLAPQYFCPYGFLEVHMYQRFIDAIFEWNFIKQSGGKHDQSVKPAAGLPHIFSDEIGWEMFFEPVFILKRIVLLTIRHGTRFKPAIKDIWHTYELFSISIDKCNLINIRTMEIKFKITIMWQFRKRQWTHFSVLEVF